VWHAATLAAPAFKETCFERTFRRDVGLPGRIWATGRAAWIPDVTKDANFPRASVAGPEGLRGAVGFPLFDAMEFLGVMEFFSRDVREPDQEVLNMVESIGRQISHFVERRRAERRLRARQEEFALARRIQQGLLPQAAPRLPGFDICGASRMTQETGGDYFDFTSLDDGRLAIAIGDASGHGVAAALVIAGTRAYLRALCQANAEPHRILALTNRRLVEDAGPDNPYVTLLLACLDPSTRGLVYSNAGHWPGYVLDRQGDVRAALAGADIPLGLDLQGAFSAQPAITLQPGDLVFLFTDGVVESLGSDGMLFGLPRALDVVRANRDKAASEILKALWREIDQFAQGARRDDQTAVIIKVQD
jgi:serine phosphatase RsbU (regulator of sigma subunit)